MATIAATKRHQDLNIHLHAILHQYLLAVDVLHDNPLADIDDHISLMQKALWRCRYTMSGYKRDHEGRDKQ